MYVCLHNILFLRTLFTTSFSITGYQLYSSFHENLPTHSLPKYLLQFPLYTPIPKCLYLFSKRKVSLLLYSFRFTVLQNPVHFPYQLRLRPRHSIHRDSEVTVRFLRSELHHSSCRSNFPILSVRYRGHSLSYKLCFYRDSKIKSH